MFRHKASTSPSSWSFFMMPVSTSCDKDRRQSKSGRSTLRGEMSYLFTRKMKYFLCLLQTCLPLLLPCSCCEPPHRGRQRLCTCWSLSLIHRPLLLLCKAACGAPREHSLLYYRLHPLSVEHWLARGRVVPVWLPWRTAAPMYDRKAESTLKMTLFYQNHNTAKCWSKMEEKAQILKSKRCWALRRHPVNIKIKLKQVWENTNTGTEKKTPNSQGSD